MLEKFINKFPGMEWPIIIFILIFSFFSGPLPLFRKYKFFYKAVKVDGIISSFYLGDKGETYAVVHYIFNGQQYKKSIEWYPTYTEKKGQHIKIYINPNDTSQVCARHYIEEFGEWMITMGCFLPILLCIICLIYCQFR